MAPRDTSRLVDPMLGLRLLGWLFVVAAAGGVVLTLLVEVAVPGEQGQILSLLACGLVGMVGVLLLAAPQASRVALPALLILGDLVWALFCWIRAEPLVTVNPVYLGLAALSVGALLGTRGVVAKCVVTVVAVPLGLAAALEGIDLVHAATLNAAFVVALTVMVRWARTRTEGLLERVERLSGHDPLTGLANRRRLEQSMPRLVERARATGGQVCAIAVDLDRFKALNDTHGHATGDRALVAGGRAAGRDGRGPGNGVPLRR